MGSRSAADQTYVRELNLSSVLRRVYHEAPTSRAQLATRTGLNKSTISSLIEDLMQRGLIRELGTNSTGAGRPATLLEINARVGAVISVELGVDFVLAAVIDFIGTVLWRKQMSADAAESQAQTLAQIGALIDEAAAQCTERNLTPLALSFAIPGTVDIDEGMLIYAPNLNWRNVAFRNLFAGQGLRVYVENDANAAAVGEHLFGEAQQAQNFVFVFAGVGLGGGLFLNGQLYRGAGGYAGEIGHTPILAQPFGLECHCGKQGCWEMYANQAAIIRRLKSQIEASPESRSITASLLDTRATAATIALIKQAADAGDPQAVAALAEEGSALGIGMAGLINVLNPEKIILGGPISMAGEHLLPAILAGVKQHGMQEIVSQAEISLSGFGPDASVIGAAAVVVDDILTNPTHVEKEVVPGALMSTISARV